MRHHGTPRRQHAHAKPTWLGLGPGLASGLGLGLVLGLGLGLGSGLGLGLGLRLGLGLGVGLGGHLAGPEGVGGPEGGEEGGPPLLPHAGVLLMGEEAPPHALAAPGLDALAAPCLDALAAPDLVGDGTACQSEPNPLGPAGPPLPLAK